MYFLDPLDRLRIERGARHLHRLGKRAIGEFLAEGIREGNDITSPAKLVVSRDGSVARSADGKNPYEQVVGFTDRWTQEGWSNAVVEALRAEHPEVFL